MIASSSNLIAVLPPFQYLYRFSALHCYPLRLSIGHLIGFSLLWDDMMMSCYARSVPLTSETSAETVHVLIVSQARPVFVENKACPQLSHAHARSQT